MTAYTVVGGGAIGGTLAFHLAGAGHDIRVVDTDEAHIAAVKRRGLILRSDRQASERQASERQMRVTAVTDGRT